MSQEEGTRSASRRLAGSYGSRAGFIRTYWHHIQYLLGRYRSYRKIDWASIERLVFVCKGNICRSAFAEAVARSMGMEAVSCGLQTVMSAPANEDAVMTARGMGYALEEHRTLPIMYIVIHKTDLVIAMEPWQAEYIGRQLVRPHSYTLLGLWSRPVYPHIQDPYGSSSAYFKRCFSYIEDSVNGIVRQIEKSRS
jgi:protein-tyrosine phosphatase